jgi:hypothetical protein
MAKSKMAKWIGTTTIEMAKIRYLNIRNHFNIEALSVLNLCVSGQAMLTVNPDKPNTTEC